jgi:[methyl-Co(III) methanol-specific corrinoid protein]:coenzyme M methyltransferase
MFKHEPVDYIPVFSGYGNITLHGVEKHGYKFSEIHTDAEKMAKVAASTYELFGFECAVAPFDMGVEAEVLGSKVNYYSHRTDVVYPTIEKPAAEKVDDLKLEIPSDLANAGGSWVLGPYTQTGQIVDLSDLSRAVYKKQALVNEILDKVSECGADAVSVECKNDVAATREKLGADALILGDIDAYSVLVNGTPEQVEQAVKDAIDKGVNALWPGCDIWPTVPKENMEALMRAAKEYGKREGEIP